MPTAENFWGKSSYTGVAEVQVVLKTMNLDYLPSRFLLHSVTRTIVATIAAGIPHSNVINPITSLFVHRVFESGEPPCIVYTQVSYTVASLSSLQDAKCGYRVYRTSALLEGYFYGVSCVEKTRLGTASLATYALDGHYPPNQCRMLT